MTRKRTSRSRRGNAGRPQLKGGITRVAFRRLLVTTVSGVTGVSTTTVTPANSGLGATDSIATQFDLFRCSELQYRIHPMDPTDTNVQAVAFVPDIDVQTVTAVGLSELPVAAVQTPFCGVPSAWSKVPRSQLKGMLDWYKCQADAGAAEFEAQGILYVAAGLASVVSWEVRGIFEMKNPVNEAVMLTRLVSKLLDRGLVSLPEEMQKPQTPAVSNLEDARKIAAKLVGIPNSRR